MQLSLFVRNVWKRDFEASIGKDASADTLYMVNDNNDSNESTLTFKLLNIKTGHITSTYYVLIKLYWRTNISFQQRNQFL